jgi:acyl carrier protein
MSDSPGPKQVLETIRACVAEALAISKDRVTSEATLMDDLQAESIDLLDIRFRLEHAFSLKIRQEEIIASLGVGAGAQEIRERLTVGSLVDFILGRLRQDPES